MAKMFNANIVNTETGVKLAESRVIVAESLEEASEKFTREAANTHPIIALGLDFGVIRIETHEVNNPVNN